MDVVKAFNTELSSLYDVKPPISKAKMTSITKSAIKGIKFYKHIVQSVEKFIQKCRPEYKVPGLYVVDSIVRQSRHQFGADKDVFGPRFIKNITITFQHLFKCNEDDRPKIIRVLNLWQKNAVFAIEVIQPLLDMGHPNTSNKSTDDNRGSRHKDPDSSHWKGWPQANDEPPPDNRTYAEMSTKNLEKFTKAEMTSAIEEEASLSMFRAQMKQELPEENTVKFNKKLLDFDYGDEEDEEEAKNDDSCLSNKPNALALSMAQNLLSNLDLLRQMQQTIQNEQALNELNLQSQLSAKPEPEEMGSYSMEPRNSPPVQQQPILPPMPFTEASSMMPYQGSIPYPPQQPPLPLMEPMSMDAAYPPALPPDQHHMQGGQADEDERVMYGMPGEPPLPAQDFDERAMIMPQEERVRKERSRSRSGSRSRRSGRHRSRSRSPRRKRSRNRSPRKSRDRSKERERIREKERERERESERKKKGLPPVKKGCVSVCSTTLWIGHVPKSCSEMEISNAFGPYGTILSIDMIPPRGCAYVVMDRRQDAYKALQKLKNLKLLQNSSVKMAWAPGKGVKGKEYKDYWEVTSGVSYVPCEKIPEDPEALDLLEEGGFIDEESLPANLKALRQQDGDKSFGAMNKMITSEAATASYNALQGPPMVPPPIIPPTSVNLPMLLHHPMQPQFGLHLPGLLPPQAMMMQVPMGIPPPNPMLMVPQQSQNLLGGQALPLVPPLVPRSVPPIASALQNLKSAQLAEPAVGSPMVPVSSAGDATPTDEDGTSVSSPSTVPKSTTISISSANVSQAAVTQFNSMIGLHNSSRPLMSVPPPASAASGAPIPYPPPNVGFNFPPPGLRPPSQPQFQWMQKQSGSYTEADSGQGARPPLPPQPGMPPHMFGNRPPFHEAPSPLKDGHNNRDSSNLERHPSDMDLAGIRSPPSHPDKMPQEMVISTDDESSMDRDYNRGDIQVGPRFQGATEFPRMPMNMHRMRGPMQGARFPPGMQMGGPFPPRMGGPRGMGGPGMHPGLRMEMEFPGNPGGRGLRMPGPHRGDPHEGRDWYARDIEGPPFEREGRFHEERGRDSWPGNKDNDSRHGPRNEGRFDDRNNNDRHGPFIPPNRPPVDGDDFHVPPSQRPGRSSGKPSRDVAEDMFKLKFYRRNKSTELQSQLNKQLEKKRKLELSQPAPLPVNKNESIKKEDPPPTEASSTNLPSDKGAAVESTATDSSNARRDREYKKRSRWGRTLSEEREFQQQKRNEIELKFQSYEQSAQQAQVLPGAPCDNSDAVTTESPASNVESVTKDCDSEVAAPLPFESEIPNTVSEPDASTQFSETPLTNCTSELPVPSEPPAVLSEPETSISDSFSEKTRSNEVCETPSIVTVSETLPSAPAAEIISNVLSDRDSSKLDVEIANTNLPLEPSFPKTLPSHFTNSVCKESELIISNPTDNTDLGGNSCKETAEDNNHDGDPCNDTNSEINTIDSSTITSSLLTTES